MGDRLEVYVLSEEVDVGDCVVFLFFGIAFEREGWFRS